MSLSYSCGISTGLTCGNDCFCFCLRQVNHGELAASVSSSSHRSSGRCASQGRESERGRSEDAAERARGLGSAREPVGPRVLDRALSLARPNSVGQARGAVGKVGGIGSLV